MSDDVVRTQEEGRSLIILLNRPGAANALSGAMLDRLASVLHRARDDRYRAVVLAANGRNFCAGSDLMEAVAEPAAMDLRTRFHPVVLALADLEKPVIAAVNGAAAGGGLSLALAADMRVMAQGARLVPSWLPIGLVPDLGASWHIAHHLGPGRAFEWLSRGEPMSSGDALLCGLANKVVPDGDERAEAVAMAERLAAIPGPAVALTRRLLAGAFASGFADQLEAEARAQAKAMSAPDQIAALDARVRALRERRPARD